MLESIDIAFVVLHYLTIDDTIECVESIRKKMTDCTYRVIVVDNSSSNGSGEKLTRLYEAIPEIHVLLNEENLGFARGNNVGFRYAKQNYDCKFIAMINNDTLILQEDFFQQVDEEYNHSHFALLGPMIMTADGKCDCTPVSEIPLDRNYIIKRLKEEEYRTKLINVGLPNPVTALKRVKMILTGAEPAREKKDYIHRRENVRIHGSFMIFGKPFIDNFEGLNEETFLYHEEEILYVQLMAGGYKTVYLPTLQIFHKEDSATNAIGRKRKDAKRFAYQCSTESCKVLLRIYDELH